MIDRILILLLMVSSISILGAQTPGLVPSGTPGLDPWTDLGSHALCLFSGPRLSWQLSALGAGGVIVATGLDQSVHNYFAGHTGLDAISTPGVYGGYLLPAGLGLGLWGGGLLGDKREIRAAGGAVLQATLLAVGYNILLKGLTGRPAPQPLIYDDARESRAFRPGLFRGGIHWGWPSGHMMTNTAAVTSLLAFYRESLPLKIVGISYLTYLFASVISHERSSMHWFSDAVTGTILGAVIGLTVGQRFRRIWTKGRAVHQQASRLQWNLGFSTFNLSWSF